MSLARRVEHLESAVIRHQIEERRQIDPGGERIDRRRFFGARNLHRGIKLANRCARA